MEQTIDRKSYRRSARYESISEAPRKISEDRIKNYNIIKMFLNQIIVSLLIILALFLLKYFEMSNILDAVKKYFKSDFTSINAINILKEKLNTVIVISGDQISGEDSGENKISGDDIIQNEFIEAVEGVNQMSDDATELKEKYDFFLPVEGIITSRFGVREKSGNLVSGYHTGLDIAQDSGMPIKAAHSGTVILAENFSSYGNCVMIQDGELITVYAHCLKLEVAKGQSIEKGQVIAKVGMTGNATGNHLHFEIRYKERYVNPEDVLEL